MTTIWVEVTWKYDNSKSHDHHDHLSCFKNNLDRDSDGFGLVAAFCALQTFALFQIFHTLSHCPCEPMKKWAVAVSSDFLRGLFCLFLRRFLSSCDSASGYQPARCQYAHEILEDTSQTAPVASGSKLQNGPWSISNMGHLMSFGFENASKHGSLNPLWFVAIFPL